MIMKEQRGCYYMRRNRVMILLLSLIMLITCSVSVHASSCNLVVECPLSGMEVSIYRIADDNGLVSPYDTYPVSLSGDLQACANALVNYIKIDNISADGYVVSGVDKKAYFNGLEKGLYLISVKPIDDGTYVYSPQVTLVNLESELVVDLKYDRVLKGSEPINLHVLKVWKNDNVDSRPSSIKVSLLRDGVVYDKQELNKLNHFSFTWNGLDSSYTYDVIEDNVPSGYTVGLSRSGNTITVTNDGGIAENISVPDKLPLTGQLWWPVPFLVIVGFTCLLIGRRYEK